LPLLKFQPQYNTYFVIYLTTNFRLHGLDNLDNSTEAAGELEIRTWL